RAFHVSGGLEIHLAVSDLDRVRAIEVPGWVPDFEEYGEEGYDVKDGSHEDDMYGGVSENLKDVKEKVDNWSDENRVNDGQEDGLCVEQHVHERVEVSNDTHESTCSGHSKKSKVPHKGRSILELIDDLINVGQTMGYDMTSESVGKSGRGDSMCIGS
nr:hypothetical protein [Tanacetum cinerariifolium]